MIPDCETARGCPLAGLADDADLNELVDSYIKVRILYDRTNDIDVFRPVITELGFYEDTDTYLKAESIFVQWQNKKKQEATRK